MTGEEIIAKVKALNLPSGEYVVFGSCPMAIHNIRESKDVDIMVSPDLYKELKDKGWNERESGGKIGLEKDCFEVATNWQWGTYNPTLEHLLETAEFIENIPFASLEEVIKWKLGSARDKDFKDIDLIKSSSDYKP